MTDTTKKAADDLAFMRALVTEDKFESWNLGFIYMAAGLLYGLQCLANGIMLSVDYVFPTAVWLAVGWLPTIIFLIVNFWFGRKKPFGKGATVRAISAAFAGGGIANLVLALMFGWVAWQKQDWSIWFLFPVVVAAFQGAIWFMIAMLSRRVWQGATAIGWFVSAVILSLLVNDPRLYVLVLGLVLIACMAVPGYIIIRSAPKRSTQA